MSTCGAGAERGGLLRGDASDPRDQGFEGAVAQAVATKLGYAASEVVWVRVPFNNAIAPGPKPYDLDINQFSITDARRKAVDFSPPYYNVRQAVIAPCGIVEHPCLLPIDTSDRRAAACARHCRSWCIRCSPGARPA